MAHATIANTCPQRSRPEEARSNRMSSARPHRTMVIAVLAFISTEPGRMLVRTGRRNAQPISATTAIKVATVAANRTGAARLPPLKAVSGMRCCFLN